MLEEIRRARISLELEVDADAASPSGVLQYITPGWDYSHSAPVASPLASPANKVNCYLFQLSQNVKTLGSLAWYLSSGPVVGVSAVFGIYDSAGEQLLCQWVSTLTSLAGGVKIAEEPDPSSELGAGSYWLAWSCTSAVPVPQAIGGSPTFSGVANAITPTIGSAGNSMSGTTLPSTLGVITGNNGSIPLLLIDIES